MGPAGDAVAGGDANGGGTGLSAHAVGTSDSVPSQDDTRRRLHELLGAVTAAVLEAQPALLGFADHRPERDRSSGSSWRGVQTLCHVSALLVSAGAPGTSASSAPPLLDAVHAVAAARGLQRRSTRHRHGISDATWSDADGDLLEVVIGVRVAVRAVSAPFLPGPLRPLPTTGGPSPLSPPPRPGR